jgi:hypothetical protein
MRKFAGAMHKFDWLAKFRQWANSRLIFRTS